MAKFSNAKIGDKVWNIILEEWGIIVEISTEYKYSVEVKFSNGKIIGYTIDGKNHEDDKQPVLFWNEVHLPTAEEDKKPFDLVDFLKENLKPKKFVPYENNSMIIYDCFSRGWKYYVDKKHQALNQIYFEESEISIVLKILNGNKIEFEELEKAFKQLGWL